METNSQFSVRKEGMPSASMTTDKGSPSVKNTSKPSVTNNKTTSTGDQPTNTDQPTVDNNSKPSVEQPKTTTSNTKGKAADPEDCTRCTAYFIAHMSMYGALFIALMALAYNLTKTAKLPKK